MWSPMRMPMIFSAACPASSGDPASLIPPALPRFPVGTCALITQGPILAAAIAASAAEMHSRPRGTGILAGARISDFAACSSKFMRVSLLQCLSCVVAGLSRPSRLVRQCLHERVTGTSPVTTSELLFPVFLPIRAKQRLFARLVFRNGGDQVRDVDEVTVVQIVRDAVAAPGAAAHAEREIEAVVVAAAIAERVRLIDQHTHDVSFLGKLTCTRHIPGMEADRVTAALMIKNLARPFCRVVEVSGPVDCEHQGQLLGGKGKSTADACFLHHEEFT